jgi:hypothetical protein
MPDAPGPSFVVQRIRWTEPGPYRRLGEWRRRLPAAYPVATFTDPAAARAECRRLEEEARQGVNPFTLGGPALFYQTSLDAGRLHDWLLDRGVTPPTKPGAGHAPWRSWWDAGHERMGGQERDAVWEALDKVRFFEVVERAAPVAYGVIELCWKVGVGVGDPLPSDCEGGVVRKLFRSRPGAERALSELGAQARENERRAIEDGVNHSSYEVTRLSGPLAPGGAYSVDDAPFVEPAEVPVADGPVGPTAYLLERVALDPEGTFCTNNNGDPTEGRVPLALYATRERAEARRRECEETARELVSPFAFPPPHNSLFYLTSVPYEGLREGVERLGLKPPGGRRGTRAGPGEFAPEAWLGWWDERVDAMTDAQREGLWALLDRLHFRAVTEVRLED